MGINLTSPAGFTTAVLIADTYQAAGGSNDSISTLTEQGGEPVSAALEIQSTTGALLLPRMTTVERDAMNYTNGMVLYNTTEGTAQFRASSAWVDVGGGSGIFDRVYVSDGTESLPSYTFLSDPAYGMWFTGGALSFSVGGTEHFKVGPLGIVSVNGSDGPAKFRLYNTGDTRYVELTVNAGLASDVSLELPSAGPIFENTPMVSNSAGVLSFPTEGMLFVNGTISSAQLKALYDTPIEVLAALPGYYYVVHRMHVEMVHATADYTGGGGVFLQYGNTPHGTIFATDLVPDVVITASLSTIFVTEGQILDGATGISAAVVDGAAVTLTNDTAAFATGGGSLNITVWYSLVAVD